MRSFSCFARMIAVRISESNASSESDRCQAKFAVGSFDKDRI